MGAAALQAAVHPIGSGLGLKRPAQEHNNRLQGSGIWTAKPSVIGQTY